METRDRLRAAAAEPIDGLANGDGGPDGTRCVVRLVTERVEDDEQPVAGEALDQPVLARTIGTTDVQTALRSSTTSVGA